MTGDHGSQVLDIVDTLLVYQDIDLYHVRTGGDSVTNQYAAVPSMVSVCVCNV